MVALPAKDEPGNGRGPAGGAASRTIAYRQDRDLLLWELGSGLLELRLTADALACVKQELQSWGKLREEQEEVGGILLGEGPVLGRTVIQVWGAESYCSPGLHHVLAMCKARTRTGLHAAAVGFYRIDAGGTGISDRDVALMCEHYADSAYIGLVIHPALAENSQAGILFWRGQHLETAQVDFPPMTALRAVEAASHESAPAVQARTLPRQAIATAAGAVVLVISTWALVHGRNPKTPPEQKAGASQRAGALGLQAQQQGTALQLVWNRESADVRNASEAVLAITDDRKQTNIRLSATELADGSFLYFPMSSNVRCQLQVLRRDGRRLDESVAVVLPNLPAAQPLVPQSLPAAALAKPLPGNLGDLAALGSLQPNSSALVRRSSVSPSTTPAAAGRSQEVQPLIPEEHLPPALPAPKPTEKSAPLLPQEPEVKTPETAAPPKMAALSPPQPDAPAPVTAPAAAEAPKIPEVPVAFASPATPVIQPKPLLPASLRAMLNREIQIQVRMRIDDTGRVLSAEPVGVSGVLAVSLAKVAVETARLWRFEPARQNGKAVTSVVDVQFKFGPGR